MAGALGRVAREVADWPAAGHEDRELGARPSADTLYHGLAASLLLREGQVLLERRGDLRKLAVAALHARRRLESPRPRVFTAAQVRWLDALVDWQPLPPDAVPVPAPGA